MCGDSLWNSCIATTLPTGEGCSSLNQYSNPDSASYSRDACWANMMMDPTNVAPEGFHFGDDSKSEDGLSEIVTRYRCQVAPVKYYFIDFEFSTWYAYPENARVTGRWGQVKTIPEMQKSDPYNPFKADIYQLGASFLSMFKVSILVESFLLQSSE